MGGFSGGDMSATRQTKDAPPLKIYEHSRTGFRTLDGSAPYENDPEGIALEGSVDLIQYSHDGEYAAIYVGEEMTIYRTADGQTVSSFHHAKITRNPPLIPSQRTISFFGASRLANVCTVG